MPELTPRIGTSGIVLPGPKATFPPDYALASRLAYYASLFNTLEINSSFYKVPMAATFAKWAAEVPDNFTFSVKLWRGITHAKKLAFSQDDIDKFMQAANQLGNKAGCLLIQFPASIGVHYQKSVEAIVERIAELNREKIWRLAVEFRHVDWYQSTIYKMLEDYEASLVIHDMPASATSLSYQPKRLAYFRFHGPTGKYRDSYSADFLARYAEKILSFKEKGISTYAYFNNTMDGALPNAQLMQTLI